MDQKIPTTPTNLKLLADHVNKCKAESEQKAAERRERILLKAVEVFLRQSYLAMDAAARRGRYSCEVTIKTGHGYEFDREVSERVASRLSEYKANACMGDLGERYVGLSWK